MANSANDYDQNREYAAGVRVAYDGAAPGIRRGHLGTIVAPDTESGLIGAVLVRFDGIAEVYTVMPEFLRRLTG